MKTRQIMLDAVKNLLQKHDIDNITVQDIIDEAGVARNTFYRYFSDKYDIVNAYFQDNITKEMMYKYNGENINEVNLEIYKFIYDNKIYFKNIMNVETTGSFLDFFYNFDKEVYCYLCKKTLNTDTLPKEIIFKIEVMSKQHCYCLKKWVDDNCSIPIDELQRWINEISLDVYSICKKEIK